MHCRSFKYELNDISCKSNEEIWKICESKLKLKLYFKSASAVMHPIEMDWLHPMFYFVRYQANYISNPCRPCAFLANKHRQNAHKKPLTSDLVNVLKFSKP